MKKIFILVVLLSVVASGCIIAGGRGRGRAVVRPGPVVVRPAPVVVIP